MSQFETIAETTGLDLAAMTYSLERTVHVTETTIVLQVRVTRAVEPQESTAAVYTWALGLGWELVLTKHGVHWAGYVATPRANLRQSLVDTELSGIAAQLLIEAREVIVKAGG